MKKRSDKKQPQAAPNRSRLELEALEPRVLLTTLFGGDTFVYVDAFDNVVEVQLEGDIIVELIASQNNPATDEIELGNLPGLLINDTPLSTLVPGRASSNIIVYDGDGNAVNNNFGAINGGLNGTIGSAVWGPLNTIGTDAGLPDVESPAPDELDIQAIATLPIGLNQASTLPLVGTPGQGDTFGFVATEVTREAGTDNEYTETRIFLVQIDTTEDGGNHQFIADVSDNVYAAYGLTPTVAPTGANAYDNWTPLVRGADFNPEDGLLYFTVESEDVDGNLIDYLFTVNILDGTVNNGFQLEGPDGPPDYLFPISDETFVSSIAFESLGLNSDGEAAYRIAFWIDTDDEETGGQLSYYDFVAGNNVLVGTAPAGLFQTFGSIPDPANEDALITGVTGIEYFNDDLSQSEQYIFLVDGDAALLYRYDVESGEIQTMGVTTTSNPDGEDGAAIGGLSFDPTTTNPFTGAQGVLFATDSETDNLLILDHRFRPSTESGTGADLYMIYVAKGDAENGRMRFSVRGDDIFDSDARVLVPFGGNSYSWVVDVTAPNAITVPGGIGGVAVGGFYHYDSIPDQHIHRDGANADVFPEGRAEIPDFVTFPYLYDSGLDLDGDGIPEVSPGVQIPAALWDFYTGSMIGSLLGNNLDIINEAAISSDGRRMAVIDVDGIDATGNPVGNEIAIIDLLTGETTQAPIEIFNNAGGSRTALTGIQGLDYGDSDGDGVDELYAIYDVSGTGGGSSNIGVLQLAADGETYTGEFVSQAAITRLPGTPPVSNSTPAADDIRITVADGSVINVDLDDLPNLETPTVQDLLDQINFDADNDDGFGNALLEVRGGNANRSLFQQGFFTHLEFIDLSAPFTVQDVGTSNLAQVLGLAKVDGNDLLNPNQIPDSVINSGIVFDNLRARTTVDTVLGDIQSLGGDQLFVAAGGINQLLSNGLGTNDITVQSSDGSTAVVDLDDAGFDALTNASDVTAFLAVLNADLAGVATVSIDAQGRFLITDDNPGGTSDFQITTSSAASSALGLSSTNAQDSTGNNFEILSSALSTAAGRLAISTNTTIGMLLDQNGNPVVLDGGGDDLIVATYGTTIAAGQGYDFNADDTLAVIQADLNADNFSLDLTSGAVITLTDDAAAPAMVLEDLASTNFFNVLFTGQTATNAVAITDNDAEDNASPNIGVISTDNFYAGDQTFYVGSPLTVLWAGSAPVSSVQAFAIDSTTGHGFALDNGSSAGVTLIEFDLSDGAAVRTGVLPTQLDNADLTFRFGTMDFASDNNLRVHDTATGRMITIDVSNYRGEIDPNTGVRTDPLSYAGIDFDGLQQISINLQDGTTDLLVDLTGANTFQGVIDRIESITNNAVTGVLGGSNSFIFTDNTVGVGTFSITNFGGTNAATLLQINVQDGGFNDFRDDVGIIQSAPNYTLVSVDVDNSTSKGSLGPSVGAITYNPNTNEFVGVDNALSVHRLLNEGGSEESAALIRLAGDDAGEEIPQDLRDLWIGGLLTGNFYASGSIETLYIGWIVTGDATGVGPFGTENFYGPYNFVVEGDVRDLLTSASLGGWDTLDTTFNVYPTFSTDTNMYIGGALGRAIVTLPGSGFYADLDVMNVAQNTNGYDYSELPYTEIEGDNDSNYYNGDPVTFNWELSENLAYSTLLAGDGRFYNNSFETAEPLGGLRNGGADGSHAIQVLGSLDFGGGNGIDFIDYYSIGLIAGQTISTQITGINEAPQAVLIGIFDPDGRLLATNQGHVDAALKINDLFSFTADVPGEYRIAVTATNNPLFSSDSGAGVIEYSFKVFGVENTAIGGIVASNIANADILAAQGDIGILRADTNQIADVSVAVGRNLRSVDALGSIGHRNGSDQILSTFELVVDAGLDVGMIRSQSPAGSGTMSLLMDVGGDVQVLDATNTIFVGQLLIDGGLGTLRVGGLGGVDTATENLTLPYISTIKVNADNSFDGDGIIDLIDVAGDVGVLSGGGPQIETGPDGNVRYMRVGGEIYQNADFSTGSYGEERVPYGESALIVDDSGATIRIAPIDTSETPDLTDEDGDGIPDNAPFITYRTFGITGSGGAVLVDIHSTAGVAVTGNSLGTDAQVDIGAIYANGLGRANIVDPVDGSAVHPDIDDSETPNELNVVIGGGVNNIVNVFYVGTDDDENGTGDTRGLFSAITNNTGGEIVNIDANNIGTLFARGVIGYGLNQATAAAVGGFILDQVDTAATYIMSDRPRTGVVSGAIESIRSFSALGNFYLSGVVTNVAADADNVDIPGLFEGINGVFMIVDDSGLDILNGNIFSMDIGEGVAPSGSGLIAEAGIFAIGRLEGESLIIGSGAIGSIVGRDASIFGDIYADTSIRTISLTGDSVINGADIIVGATSPEVTLEYAPVATNLISGLATGEPLINRVINPNGQALGERQPIGLNQISINGTGGIIGATIGADLIGNIRVNNGFGILNTQVLAPGTDGQIDNINIDGYGLRGSYVMSAGDIGNIILNGRGEQLAVTDFTNAARASEYTPIDPATGIAFNPFTGLPIERYNDLHIFLGTNAVTPGTSDLDNAGVIDSSVITTAEDLTGQIRAFQILSTLQNQGFPFNAEILSDAEGNTLPAYTYINVAGKLNKIDITSSAAQLQDHHNVDAVAGLDIGTELTDFSVAGLSITAGQLVTFNPGANVVGLDLTVAGLIRNLRFEGDLLSLPQIDASLFSSISAIGPAGQITNLTVDGDMQADILASAYINRISIGGDLTGSITVLNGDSRGRGLGTLTLGGSLVEGGLDITGDVNAIRIDGSVGAERTLINEVADQLLITGDLNTFQAGRMVDGANVALDLVILGDMRNFDVSGQFTGELFVGGDLSSFRINADNATRGTTILGSDFGDVDIVVGGTLGKVSISGGDVGDGDTDSNEDSVLERVRFTAGEGIRNFSVTNGSVLSDVSVAASLGDINAINVRGGDFYGRIDANAGSIRQIRISGSDFGGALSALEVSSFTIDGSILTGATIGVDDAGRFTVGEDIQAGVLVSFGQADALTVRNDLDGTLLVEDAGGRFNLSVLNNVSGQIFIGGDASINVRGDLESVSSIPATATLESLGITASPGSTIEIQLRDGTNPVQVDLTGITTFAEFKAAIEDQVPFVTVQIDPDQEAILLTDESPNNGSTFSISDIGNSNIANSLGISTVDGGVGDRDNAANGVIEGAPIGFSIVNSTQLSDFGTRIAPESDLRFTLSTNAVIDVSLAGDETLQDVIDSINAAGIIAGVPTVTASIDPTGTALQVTDASGNGLRIQNGVDSRMAERLGIVGTDGDLGDTDGSLDGTVTGARLAGALIFIDGDARSVRFDDINGNIFVTGELGRLTTNSITSAVIAAGQDIGSVRVRGDVNNAFVQAGILPSAGIEQVALQISQDLPGQAVVIYNPNPTVGTDASRGSIGTFQADDLVESVLAAGGEFGRLVLSGDVTDSTASSGIVFGVSAISSAANDATPLANAAERNDARGTAGDRIFTHGDFDSISIRGTATTSAFTAGIDPGDDGIFDNNTPNLVGAPNVNDSNIHTSITGGRSAIGMLMAGGYDGATLALSDQPISRTDIPGGQQAEFTYTIDAIDGAAGSPVSLLPVTVIAPNPDGSVTVNGLSGSVTIRPSHGASITVYDDNLGDDVIDAIVINGGGRNASVTIVDSVGDSADWSLERLLSDDDVELGSFSFEGTLVGDDTTGTVDLWIESGLRSLELGGFAETTVDGLNARVADDILSLEIGVYGGGDLIVGGEVRTLSIGTSENSPVLGNASESASSGITELTFTNAGVLYTFDGTTGLFQTSDVSDAATFTISDNGGSTIAADLGIVAIDGSVGDNDQSGNNAILGSSLSSGSISLTTTLDELGINPAGGSIDFIFRDGNTATIDLSSATTLADVAHLLAAGSEGRLSTSVTDNGELRIIETSTTTRVTIDDTLASGVDIDPGETLTISLRDNGDDLTINLSNVYTVQDLLDAINEQSFRYLTDGGGNPLRDADGNIIYDRSTGQLLTATISADNNGLQITDNSNNLGGTFQISVDDPESDLISVFGLNVTDGGVGEGAADGDILTGRALLPDNISTSLAGLLGSAIDVNQTQRLSIDLQDGSSGVTVDLTGLTTFEAVADAIYEQTDQRVTLLSVGGGRFVAIDNTTGAGTFAIADAVGDLGERLGIAAVDNGADNADRDAAQNARITGRSVVNTDTRLDALGIDVTGEELLSFDLADGDPSPNPGRTGFTLSIAGIPGGITTIGDLIDAVNVLGVNFGTANGLSLELRNDDVSGSYLVLTDDGGNSTLRISDVQGTLAHDLGLAGFDGGPTDDDGAADGELKSGNLFATTSSLLNTNLVFTGAQTFQLDLADGSNFTIDLAGVDTLSGVINAIETAGAGTVTAGVDGTGRLFILDNTAGANPFTVTQLTGDAAIALGLLPSSGIAGVADGVINTLPITDILSVNTSLSGGLNIDFQDELLVDVQIRNGSIFSIDLSTARTIEQVFDAINQGTAGLVSAEYGPGGRIILTDSSAGASSFSVTDDSGVLASRLGIAGTDGQVNDTDGLIDGVITGQTILRTSTQLSMLGIDPTAGVIDVDYRDGTSGTITLQDASFTPVTIADVAQRLASQSAGRLSLSITIDGRFSVSDSSTGAGTLAIADNGGSTIARDLGIAATDGTDNDATTNGRILGNQLLASEAQLPASVNLAGAQTVRFALQNGTNVDVSLDDANTFGEIIDAINRAGLGNLTAHLASDARLVIYDNTSGANTFTITDNVGTAATQLGIVATDGGAGDQDGNALADAVIKGTSIYGDNPGDVLLEDLGIRISAGDAFSITTSDNVTSAVTFGVAPTTLDDLITEIQGDVANVTATVGLDGRLILTDTSGGATVAFRAFTATGQQSYILDQLGLEASDGGAGDTDRQADDAISGQGVVTSSTRMSLLGISATGAEEMLITLQDGTSHVIDVTDALNIFDIINAIETETGGDVTVTIDSGERLLLTDNSVDNGGRFTVTNLAGSPASALGILTSDIGAPDRAFKLAYELGIAGVDGQDQDGTANGVIVSDTVLASAFDLNDLGISTANGQISIQMRDGTLVTANLGSATSLLDISNAIETATSGDVTLLITTDGRLQLSDATAGASTFTIADVGTSTIAADLGIDTTDGGADDNDAVANGVIVGDSVISNALTLESLGFNATGAGINILLQDGTPANIDLSAATSIDDIATAIAAGTGGNLTVIITPDGALQLTDATVGGSTLRISDDAILGNTLVDKMESDSAMSGPVLNTSIDHGVDLRIQLRDGDEALSINLYGAQTLQDVADYINAQANRYSFDAQGNRTVLESNLVTATVNSNGQLVITDNTTGSDSFQIVRTDEGGNPLESQAAVDLGLVANLSTTDGGSGDYVPVGSAPVDGVITSTPVPGATSPETRLDAIRSQLLGLDFEPGGSDLYAILEGLDLNPEQIIGQLYSSIDGTGLPQSLSVLAMAANNDGEIYAVVREAGGNDMLATINPVSGQASVLGLIENSNGILYSNNVTELAFTPDGQLLAVVDDADGNGSLYTELQGPAMGIIEVDDANNNGRYTIRRVGTNAGGDLIAVNLPLRNIAGNIATAFGVATVDNDLNRDTDTTLGTIQGRDLRQDLTGEEDIVADLGITLDPANPEITITVVDSTLGLGADGTFDINIDPNDPLLDVNGDAVITLQETINYIVDEVGADTITLEIAADGTGLVLTDLTTFDDTNATNITTVSVPGGSASDMATLLGIGFQDGLANVDRDGAENQQIFGRDIRLAMSGTDLLTDFDFIANTNRYINYTKTDGATGTIDLTAAVTVQDVLNAITAEPDLTATIANTTQTLNFGATTFDERITSALSITDASGGTVSFSLGANDAVEITGIAVNDDGTIYAVLNDTIADTDRLAIINPQDLTVSNAASGNALIQLPGGVDTDIDSIGFDASGLLLAYDSDAGNIISIDTTQDTPADASLLDGSIRVPAGGDIDGVFFDRSGGRYGTLVYAYDLIDSDGNLVNDNAELYVSNGFGSIAGTVDVNTGVFSRLRSVDDGTAITIAYNNRAGILPSDVDAGLFAVDSTGELIQINPTTGDQVANLGVITDVNNGNPLTITELEFDVTIDAFVGLDATRNRLVSLELIDTNGDGTLDAAVATPLLQAGAVNANNFNGLAYNPADSRITAANTSGQLVAISASGPGGVDAVQADSYSRVTIDGEFENRLVATGNSFSTVTAGDHFGGIIETNGDIRSFTLTAGNFTGVLSAGRDIGNVNIRTGDMLAGSIEAGHDIRSIRISGDMDGQVSATSIGNLRVNGDVGSNGEINASELRSIRVAGEFDGSLTLDTANNLSLGDLGSNADITVLGDTGSVRADSVAEGATILITGDLRMLSVRNDFAGSVATSGSLDNVTLGSATNAIVLAGTNLGNVNVRGDLDRSLISAGVWIGNDGVYNTTDDQIFGGYLSRVTVRGDVIESAIVAGVLPSIEFGPGMPDDLTAFTGNPDLVGQDLDSLDEVDSAEAGGLLASGIGHVSLGRVFGAGAGSQQASVVAAAGEIENLRGVGTNLMLTREYEDLYNAPSVIDTGFFDAIEITPDINPTITYAGAYIVFSEEVLSTSLVLAQDTNNDGDLEDADDIRGSIAVIDTSGDSIRYLDSGDGVQLSLSYTYNDRGELQSIVTVYKADGFPTDGVQFALSGSLSDTVVLDRSGLRSILRDVNNDGVVEVGEDAAGTVFDGDNSGKEGGGSSIINYVSIDLADSFTSAATFGTFGGGVALNLPAGSTTSQFDSVGDIDIFTFDANAYEFISVNFQTDSSDTLAEIGIFYRDTQGTESTSDDTYELVTNWDTTSAGTYVHGVELTETGQYYVVVYGGAEDDYTLEVARASSDLNLLSNTPDLNQSQIDYTSNYIGQNGNQIGFNDPRQLVYLNFDGGTAENFAGLDGVDVDFAAFDADILNVQLSGLEAQMISNIMDNVVSLYGNIPASTTLYDGTVNPTFNVQGLSADIDAYLAATEGLFFTTVDPELTGLDIEYTTVYIGESNYVGGGFYGIANDIDGLNMDKDNEVLVVTEAFSGSFDGDNFAETLENYTTALSNVIAHELGHVLGFNHSFREPYGFDGSSSFMDDPDNNPDTPNDGNFSAVHLQTSGGDAEFGDLEGGLFQLATSPVFTAEFPVGDIDTVDMLLRALT